MRQTQALFASPSRDGYVRLPEQALAALQLVHVDSGLDEELLEELRADDIDALNAGYTEWQRARAPGCAQISVGWGWYLDGGSGALLIAWSDVRSNIMCVDSRGADLGMIPTAQLLIHRLAQLNWPNTVVRATQVSCRRADLRGPTLQ